VIPLACALHWYEGALFVVPTCAISVWGWWGTRVGRHRH
jgi:hypothetical protein